MSLASSPGPSGEEGPGDEANMSQDYFWSILYPKIVFKSCENWQLVHLEPAPNMATTVAAAVVAT